MMVYWLMFWFPFLGAISPRKMVPMQARVFFLIVCSIYTVFIGLRDEIGGDWFNYLPMFQYFSTQGYEAIFEFKDPGYSYLLWSVGHAGGSIYTTNLICAVLTMIGVYRFCRDLPDPWLALLVAVPYMLIVVAMGYTRQAVALSAAMYGLTYLGRGRVVAFVICVAFGALFHSSAVLLIPIAGLATSKRKIWTAAWVALAFIAAYFVLLHSETEDLWKNYVTDQDVRGNFQHSYGAVERVLMNALPAALLLIYRKRFLQDMQMRRLWIVFCWLAMACLLFVAVASTAVDRIALYLLPLQLFVFSRLPNLAKSVTTRTVIVMSVVAYYAAVQYVWLNYAVMREFWVPYHFMPLDG